MATQIHIIGQDATLDPGESHFWEYWFDDFIDAGVCHASIATDNAWLGHLQVVEQGMIANLRMPGGVVQWGQRRWSYTVTVRNDSNGTVAYHLRVARLLP